MHFECDGGIDIKKSFKSLSPYSFSCDTNAVFHFVKMKHPLPLETNWTRTAFYAQHNYRNPFGLAQKVFSFLFKVLSMLESSPNTSTKFTDLSQSFTKKNVHGVLSWIHHLSSNLSIDIIQCANWKCSRKGPNIIKYNVNRDKWVRLEWLKAKDLMEKHEMRSQNKNSTAYYRCEYARACTSWDSSISFQ